MIVFYQYKRVKLEISKRKIWGQGLDTYKPCKEFSTGRKKTAAYQNLCNTAKVVSEENL